MEEHEVSEVVCSVVGMSCQNCVRNVEYKIGQIIGVLSITVSLVGATAKVEIQPKVFTQDDLVIRIRELGFDSEVLSSVTSLPEVRRFKKVEDLAREAKTDPVTPSSITMVPDQLLNRAGFRSPTCIGSVKREGLVKISCKGSFPVTKRVCQSERILLQYPVGISDDGRKEILMRLSREHGVLSTSDKSMTYKQSGVQFSGISVVYSPEEVGVRRLVSLVEHARPPSSPHSRIIDDSLRVYYTNLEMENKCLDSLSLKSLPYFKVNFEGLKFPGDCVDSELVYSDVFVKDEDIETPSDELYRKTKTMMQLSLPPCFILLMLHEFAGDMGVIDARRDISLSSLIQIAISLFVVYYCGQQFHKKAYTSLKHRSLTMDLMVSLNSNVCIIFSLFQTMSMALNPKDMPSIHPGSHFYSTATLLMTVLLGGRVMEAKAKHSAQRHLTALQTKQRSSVVKTVMPIDGSFARDSIGIELKSIPVRVHIWTTSSLQIGDVILVEEGDEVPADGIILNCSVLLSLDESCITGDKNRISKLCGDPIFARSVLCGGKALVVVTSIGTSTMIGEVIHSVEDVNEHKIGLQKTADKLAKVFIPTVFTFSILTFVAWYYVVPTFHLAAPPGPPISTAITFAVAVLAMACPCAIGLATPIVVSLVSSQSHKLGIILKNAPAIDRISSLKYVVLDKTGTLTDSPVFLNMLVHLDAHKSLHMLEHTKLYKRISELDFIPCPPNSSAAPLQPEPLGPSMRAIMWTLMKVVEDGGRSVEVLHPFASAIVKEANKQLSFRPKMKGCCKDRPSGIVSVEDAQMKGYVFSSSEDVIISNASEIPGVGSQCQVELPVTSREDNGGLYDIVSSSVMARLRMVKADPEAISDKAVKEWVLQEQTKGRSVSVFLCRLNDGPETILSGLSTGTPLNKNAVSLINDIRNTRLLHIALCTGDNSFSAHKVAAQLGIHPRCVVANCGPADKVHFVRSLQMNYTDAISYLDDVGCHSTDVRPVVQNLLKGVTPSEKANGVMFIGDGLNDAGALCSATVGVSFGCGVELSIPFADIVVVNRDLRSIERFLTLSNRALRTVRQNYSWALVFNGIGLPFAAGFGYPYVILPPWMCAFMMSLSSIVVVLNSKRGVGGADKMSWNIRTLVQRIFWWKKKISDINTNI
eukprot:GHVH01010463.1.p1 GENE.GHVH01010463.1~~GHVH01010463.1.p1  ORF type:complete len:1151 (+),score=151.52 GHVH01010463.1:88-3540(+)